MVIKIAEFRSQRFGFRRFCRDIVLAVPETDRQPSYVLRLLLVHQAQPCNLFHSQWPLNTILFPE
jgi:hypothetical protein